MANNFPKFTSFNFSFDFFEKRSIHPFYQSIFNKTNGKLLANDISPLGNLADLTEIKLIPPYLQPNYNDLTLSMNICKIYRIQGYMANLNGFSDLDHYMAAKMSAKHRSKIRNRVRRLEKCFNISYKIYFGEITKKEYDNLFERFESLIKRRFAQRGETHQSINNWGVYKKTTYQLVLEKKASLFVIYNRNKPIDICLNYHYQNIVNHSIRSYDIDYSKFNLGNIDIYKQLEWCFENNFKIFDLRWGDLEYKQRWCNEIYLYEHHLFYNKNYNPGSPLAYLIVNLYKLKDFIKNKIRIPFLRKLISFFKIKQDQTNNMSNYTIEKTDVRDIRQTDDFIEINLNTEEYAFLRKPTYDFQFGFSEATKDIGVYKLALENESYIIIGKKSSQKLNFK